MQQKERIPADADVAVGEQQCLPAPFAGDGLEDVTQQRAPATRPGLDDGGAGHIDAQGREASRGQCLDEPARSAPDVDDRSGAPTHDEFVHAGHRQPGGHVERLA